MTTKTGFYIDIEEKIDKLSLIHDYAIKIKHFDWMQRCKYIAWKPNECAGYLYNSFPDKFLNVKYDITEACPTTFTMTDSAIQELMNKMWYLGFRPTNCDGEIDPTKDEIIRILKENITDLRTILFEEKEDGNSNKT